MYRGHQSLQSPVPGNGCQFGVDVSEDVVSSVVRMHHGPADLCHTVHIHAQLFEALAELVAVVEQCTGTYKPVTIECTMELGP